MPRGMPRHARCLRLIRTLLAASVVGTALLLPATAESRVLEGRTVLRAQNAVEKPLIAAINRERRRHGLGPLRLSKRLAKAADAHARAMGAGGFFAHESKNGQSAADRIRRRYPGSSIVGETLLWRSPGVTARQALRMWLGSPPHRKVLLTRAFREVGLGAVRVTSAPGIFRGLDVTIVVADFGARR